MNVTLTPHPDGGHSPDYTLQVADAISEAVRVLNHATFPSDSEESLPYPSTVYDVVGRLQAAAAGMDQLVRQLAGRLTEIAATQDITVDDGIFRDDPAGAVGDALEMLDDARRAAGGLEEALRAAQNALSSIGVRTPEDDD